MDAKLQADAPTDPVTVRQPGELTPGQIRGLKIAIVVMGVMILGSLLLMVARIVYLAGDRDQQVPVSSRTARDAHVSLPTGAQIRNIVVNGNRLAIHHDAPSGPGITVIDAQSGQVLSRIVIVPEAPRP